MKHVMLDIETLGIKPGCAILSIGAVEFGPEGIGEQFYRTISNPVGDIEVATMRWWLKQPRDICEALFDDRNASTYITALTDFYAWFRACNTTYLWCHGATFDEPIMRWAPGAIEDPPWKFWNVRCTRTLYMLSGFQPSRDKHHHHALADALSQANAAILSLNKLGWPEV